MEIRSVFYLAHERNFTDPINSKCQDIALPPHLQYSLNCVTKGLADMQSHIDVIT